MTETRALEVVLEAWNAGEYQRVVACGASVIESGRDASAIVMLYADALVELGRTADAREAYKLALTILPLSRHRRICDALAALELSAECYSVAEEYSRRAIALDPDHASGYIYLGVCYASTDRIADAEAQFLRATVCREGAIDEAWFNLGRVQSTRGRKTDGAISFGRALAIDPKYEEARKALHTLKGEQHRTLEA
jgi:tetratricopeptide (TPR) repeat protein